MNKQMKKLYDEINKRKEDYTKEADKLYMRKCYQFSTIKYAQAEECLDILSLINKQSGEK